MPRLIPVGISVENSVLSQSSWFAKLPQSTFADEIALGKDSLSNFAFRPAFASSRAPWEYNISAEKYL
jgi:hypothetical protein